MISLARIGRDRSFDEAVVLELAAAIFSQQGYEATSVDDLVRGLSLHRGSLYQAFGSKRQLFVRALRTYVDNVLVPVAGELAEHGPKVRLIEDLLTDDILDLLLVAALEAAPNDPEVATEVERAMTLLVKSVADYEPSESVAVAALFGGRLATRAHHRLLTAQRFTQMTAGSAPREKRRRTWRK